MADEQHDFQIEAFVIHVRLAVTLGCGVKRPWRQRDLVAIGISGWTVCPLTLADKAGIFKRMAST